jgi:hypothetical protein
VSGNPQRVGRVDDVEVGMTRAGGADAHEHFSVRRLRLGRRAKFSRVRRGQSKRMHDDFSGRLARPALARRPRAQQDR